MLRIRTFGGCDVERSGVRLTELAGQRRPLAFLAVLAGSGERGITRESLAALFWPDSDDERARTSLKQLVYSIRRQLHVPELLLGTGDLRLNPSEVTSDVQEFRDAVRRRDWATAADVYAGPFLDGFHLRNADGFERWVSGERTTLARDVAKLVEKLANEAGLSGDQQAAVQWWRRLATAEPLSARIAVMLMRALDAAGERTAALQHARAYQLFVQAELEEEPDSSVSAEVLRLRHAPATGGVTVPLAVVQQHKRNGAPAQSPVSKVATRAELPSLAVLPFVNTSADAEDEHFSDGLTDELIGTLGKIRGLTVIGRTSSFAFKGTHLSACAIAASLRVTALLEGSVRRWGERLKIGAQLVRADDGAVIWSGMYDRHASDIFLVQSEIAQAIAGVLQVTLASREALRTRPATADLDAYELYLKGRYFQNRVSPEDLQRSIRYFEQAIACDLSYAKAYAGLADALLLLAVLGDISGKAQLSRVRAAVSSALALDDTLAEAHTSLASVLFGFDWNWTGAGEEFARAIALDPDYGLAHQRYGLYLLYQGRFDEALPVFERARTLDPLAPSASMNLGRLHLSAGRADVAIPFLQFAVELNPRLALAHEQLGHARLQVGEHDAAVADFRAAAVSGTRGAGPLAYALAMTGHRSEAQAIVSVLLQSNPGDGRLSLGLAVAYAGLGDINAAFACLDQAFAERDAFLHSIKTAPALRALHIDPRWNTLLARIGLSS